MLFLPVCVVYRSFYLHLLFIWLLPLLQLCVAFFGIVTCTFVFFISLLHVPAFVACFVVTFISPLFVVACICCFVVVVTCICYFVVVVPYLLFCCCYFCLLLGSSYVSYVVFVD